MKQAYSNQNLESFFDLFGMLSGEAVVHTPHFDFIKSTGFIWPNQIYNLRFENTLAERVLEEIIQGTQNGTLPALYMANPKADSSHFIHLAVEKGYTTGAWQAMSYNLTKPLVDLKNPVLEIRLLKTRDELQAWLAIAENELMGGGKLDHSVFEKLMVDEHVLFYMGMINNKPISTALLYCHENNAGVYFVATEAEHRGRGFGSEITMHCLRQAKQLGMRAVHLQATQLGKGVYQKLGFDDHGDIKLVKFQTTKTT